MKYYDKDRKSLESLSIFIEAISNILRKQSAQIKTLSKRVKNLCLTSIRYGNIYNLCNKDLIQTAINVQAKRLFKTPALYISFLFLTVSCGPLFSANKPYFWKVEKDGKTSHFLGTLHNGIPLTELLCSDTIITQLKNSDLVLTELGEGIVDPQQRKVWKETLHLSPNNEDFNQLSPESQRFLERNGISKELSYNAMTFALSKLCMRAAVGEEAAQISMDDQVEATAIDLNIPLQALDTLELRRPVKEHTLTKEYIEQRIETFPWCPASIQYLIFYYKRGQSRPYEVRGLDRWLQNRYSRDENDKWLLKNRNEKWVDQFKEAHKSYDRIFVAAGNLHFTGAFNLVDILRRDGFKIERVSCR